MASVPAHLERRPPPRYKTRLRFLAEAETTAGRHRLEMLELSRRHGFGYAVRAALQLVRA
jgi:hypothetical protein